MNTANDKKLFWGCFCALVSTAFAFVFRDMIIDEWGRQFALTQTQKGEILGVGLWPFAVSIIIFSLIIDRIGYKLVMTLAFVFQVASVLITISAPLFLAKEGASQAEVDRGFEIGYWLLYAGSLVVALGNGMVEAVINPVIATMFAESKTKWLNILHAGWPGGLVLGGVLFIGLGDTGTFTQMLGGQTVPWGWKVSLILIPTVIYFVLMIGCQFPVHERVAAGVSYLDMLKEIGIVGALVVVAMFARQIGMLVEAATKVDMLPYEIAFTIIAVGAFAFYVRSLGRPMFVFLCIIMIPLAITELGVDSWITPLMEKDMKEIKWNAGWVMVYASFIMTVLRFQAGPIVEKLSPLGLLATCAAIAAAGLCWLSLSTGFMIFGAATLYGIGKTFFWPTMLGVVSEQFPKGGALTLNVVGGIGMLGVGVIGTPLMGLIQDNYVDSTLKPETALYSKFIEKDEKSSIFGPYRALDAKKVTELNLKVGLYETRDNVATALKKETGKDPTPAAVDQKLDKDLGYLAMVREAYNQVARPEGDSANKPLDVMVAGLKQKNMFVDAETFKTLKQEKEKLEDITNQANKRALLLTACFPVFMLVCYLILLGYFYTKGGYKPVVLAGHEGEKGIQQVEGLAEM